MPCKTCNDTKQTKCPFDRLDAEYAGCTLIGTSDACPPGFHYIDQDGTCYAPCQDCREPADSRIDVLHCPLCDSTDLYEDRWIPVNPHLSGPHPLPHEHGPDTNPDVFCRGCFNTFDPE